MSAHAESGAMARKKAKPSLDLEKFRTFVREHYLREAFALAAKHGYR